MNAHEVIGYLASLLVLATFCMRGMVALRLVSMASNVAFFAYGVLAEIWPVFLLHLILLPTNAWRLIEAVRDQHPKVGAMAGGTMATDLSIDPELLDRVLEVSGERTTEAAVTWALEEFIARRQSTATRTVSTA